MSPSAKKRPKDMVVSKMQDEKQQVKTEQPASKVVERNRLKMVLRNLSLLKVLKSSNRRIQELHTLARRCWNSMLQVPKILRISSRANDDCNTVKQNNKEHQETRFLEKKPESKRAKSTEEPKATEAREWRPEVASERRHGTQESLAPAPEEEKRPEPEASLRWSSPGPSTGARARPPPPWGRQVAFLKTYRHRTHTRDTRQLDVADQCTWFEGLPTRIHLPGPRVGCRASILRTAKRCCTRLCSASLEQPMLHLYKVV